MRAASTVLSAPATDPAPRRSDRARHARGLTLVELVLLISIVGVLAMLAVPERSVFEDAKLHAAARRLVSDLRYAQSRSVSTRSSHRVVFDPGAARYAVTTRDRATPVADPADRGRALAMDYRTHDEFRGIVIESASFGGGSEVSFDLLGAPRTASGASLTSPGSVVLRYAGETVAVDVAPSTGLASIR